MGSAINDLLADQLLADAARADHAARPGAHLLLDCRHKSFTDLNAQRRLSSGAFRAADLPSVHELAVWAPPEQAAVCPADTTFVLFCDPDRAPAPPWVRARFAADRASVHLVAGSTGAGKSTYAIDLSRNVGAIHFGIDDWMQRLFGDDRPADAGFDWYMPRIERCEAHIWQLVRELNSLSRPAVLDLGLTTADHRARVLSWADRAGIAARLHFIDAPAERRWQRVVQRNQERGETFRLEVTRDMFDFVEGMFEVPTPDEADNFVHWRS